MKNLKFLLFISVIIQNACVPVPIPRKAVIQPACTFKIEDENGGRLPECRITFYSWKYPYRQLVDILVLKSDSSGTAYIEELIKKEWVFPLMMHGVPVYNWTYIVECENYQKMEGIIHQASKKQRQYISLVMLKEKPKIK